MRIKTQIKTASTDYEWTPPVYIEGGLDGTQARISDQLHTMLGWRSLDFVEIHHKSGLVTRYYAWEYPCMICGEYGHGVDDCPTVRGGDDSIAMHRRRSRKVIASIPGRRRHDHRMIDASTGKR